MADEQHEFPIDGVLDLHAFQPRDVKGLIPEYIRACLEKNILHIRIIHGKGTGTLRRIVHSQLEKDPRVLTFKTSDAGGGGWGATEVTLRSSKR